MSSKKIITEQVQISIADYLQKKDKPCTFTWNNLPGTGSTSERYLVRAVFPDEEICFVVKHYCIFDQHEEESLLQSRREYNALECFQAIRSKLWHSPLPIAYLPAYATIVMEFFPGESVSRIFWQTVRWSSLSRIRLDCLLNIMNDIASITREIQGHSCSNNRLPVADETWYMSFLEEQIRALRGYGFDGSRLRGLQARVSVILPQLLSTENVCLQHTDLYFNNIMSLNDHYCVLDLPNACQGTRYWDISHMLVSLEHYLLFRNVDSQIITACLKEFRQQFILQEELISAMHLIHYVFSLKLCCMVPRSGLKRFMMCNPLAFYEYKIDAILSGKKV